MIFPSIADGVSHGSGHCSIVLRPMDDEVDDLEYDSMYVEWSNKADSKILELGFVASGLAKLGNSLYVLGRLGNIVSIDAGVVTQEAILDAENFGFLTDIKVINEYIYVVGMSRQVYERNRDGNWKRLDAGVLDDGLQVENITGFRAIDGVANDDLYAVGLEGEIWNYKNGVWKKIESPTNMILEQVKVVNPKEVYAVGQAGIILRGNGDVWEIIQQAETKEDFWGMDKLGDLLYLATASDLYTLDSEDELKKITPVDGGPRHFARLRASQGVLWSFGPHEAWWTSDGILWEEAQIFSQAED